MSKVKNRSFSNSKTTCRRDRSREDVLSGSIALSSGIRMKKLAIIIGLISEALNVTFSECVGLSRYKSGRLEVLTYLMIVDIDGKGGVIM